MMAYDKRFTNRLTQSVLEIRIRHFYVRPSQAWAARLGFIFPSSDNNGNLMEFENDIFNFNGKIGIWWL